MAKLPFMTGRYKWFLKVLSVCAEFKGEDPNAECRRPTSAKEYNITTDNPALLEKTGIRKSADKKVKIYTPVKTHFYNEKSSKLPFMAGCYEWFLKALPVCECKSEDPNAEHREPTSTKEKKKDTADSENTGMKSDGKKEPRKVFNDPIHGHIQLHPLLVKIIDTPEFQRLRNIKQLGGVYFVYPGASHNRFEHSIGVAHLAGELAKALRTKQLEELEELEKKLKKKQSEHLAPLAAPLDEPIEPKQSEHLAPLAAPLDEPIEPKQSEHLAPLAAPLDEPIEPKQSELLKLTCKQIKLKESLISDQDILCVQIAGLCHDLGHGPFSHLFDGMFIPEVSKASKEGKEDKEEKWTHEEASIKMFDHLLKKNKLIPVMKECELKIEGEDENDLTFIKELINGPQKNNASPSKWPYKGRREEKSFLYEIVSNKRNGIDVDKFDYFARDCHHLGIRSNFDHQRFIIFARVCKVNGRKQICSRDKEVANLYELFHTRHSLHRRACQHKIKMAVEIMIKDALLKADQHIRFQDSEGQMLPISKAKDDMEAYTKLTDQVIETILNFPSPSPSPSLEEARKILQRVMTRDLYQCVGQATLKKKDQVKISEEMKESLEKKLLKDIPRIGKDNFEITVVTFDYGMKDKDPISKAYFYRKGDTQRGIPITKSKVSKFLPEQFYEEILRLYWKNGENTGKAKKCFKTWCNENGFEVEEEDNDAPY